MLKVQYLIDRQRELSWAAASSKWTKRRFLRTYIQSFCPRRTNISSILQGSPEKSPFFVTTHTVHNLLAAAAEKGRWSGGRISSIGNIFSGNDTVYHSLNSYCLFSQFNSTFQFSHNLSFSISQFLKISVSQDLSFFGSQFLRILVS